MQVNLMRQARRLFLFGWMVAIGAGVASRAFARPTTTAGLFGLGVDELRSVQLTSAQLSDIEKTWPSQFYGYDFGGISERVDKSLFDPYLDTHPFKNQTPFGAENGTCFGMAMQIGEWYQRWYAQRGHPAAAADRIKRLRDHVVVGGRAESERTRTDRGRSTSILTRAIELQPTQFGIGEIPTPRGLFEDYILRDMLRPERGSSVLNLALRDGHGRLRVPHAVLVIGLVSGEATNVRQISEDRVEASSGKHRIPAVRVDLWDSNFPFLKERDVTDWARLPHLLYFPRAGTFSLPRNDWYRAYQDGTLSHIEAKERSDERRLLELQRWAMLDTLLQPQPTYLARAALQFPDVHDTTRIRQRREIAKSEGFSLNRLRRNVSEGERSQYPRRRGGAMSLASSVEEDGRGGYWEPTAHHIDDAFDNYIRRVFSVDDPDSTDANGAFH